MRRRSVIDVNGLARRALEPLGVRVLKDGTIKAGPKARKPVRAVIGALPGSHRAGKDGTQQVTGLRRVLRKR